jgi:hypothetical protein
MDGHYQNNSKLSYKEKIFNWMQNTITEKLYGENYDLHLDVIDHAFKNKPKKWIIGSLKCFEYTIDIRDKYFQSFAIGWAFSLKSKNIPIGINFNTVQELMKQFDYSPPSLYLFQKGKEPWIIDKDDFTIINSDIFSQVNIRYKCLYLEIMSEYDDDYIRSFWMTA